MPRIRTLMTVLLLLGFAGAAWAATSDSIDTLLHNAVNGSWRSAEDKSRDQYRHPVETLEFFGLKPDMTVVELAPGGGWYTQILAPVLREHGHLIEAGGHDSGPYADMLKAHHDVFGDLKIIPFSPPDKVNLGPDGSADMVLTFRNTHDWLNKSDAALESAFKAAYAVLKPGGVFGVVEHRARPYSDAEISSRGLHRIPEDYMISLGLKNGFVLAGVSEINANPNDDESVNVHRLMPDLLGGDQALKTIGESDRMTLKFVKPANPQVQP